MNYHLLEGGLVEQSKPDINAHFGPWNSTDEYLSWIRGITKDPSYSPQSGVKVGILQDNGTVRRFLWQKPYNTEGYWEELDAASGTSIQYFDSIAALKQATGLKAGDIVATSGYYTANDGGGSTFIVVGSTSSVLNIYEGAHSYKGKAQGLNWKQAVSGITSPYVDDATLVALQNDLYADIIVPSNMEVNFLQMGAERIYSYSKTVKSSTTRYSVQHDNRPYMMKWLAFNDRRMTTYNLFIPAGAYSFSETWLLRNHENTCSNGIRIRGECMQLNASGTIFMPHYAAQEYIIRIGYRTKGKYTSSVWLPMRDVVFNNISFGTTRYAISNVGYAPRYGASGIGGTLDPSDDATAGNDNYRYVTRAALWLDSCPYSQFDGLYFKNVAGTLIYFTQCYESHFGYTNVRQCGRISKRGYASPLFYFAGAGASDISACYFYYFNIEGSYGNIFYGKPGNKNFTHCEINNIQIEGSMPSGAPLPIYGYLTASASSYPYTSDSGYVTPEFTDSGGNPTAVFGRWFKWYMFAGSIGYMANCVKTISASNFGNGFRRYRTYERTDNGNVVDIDGNAVDENSYVEENSIVYAVNPDGLKIVDYYRFYALIGVDNEETPSNESAMYLDVGNIYFNRDLSECHGPWIVYSKGNAAVYGININQLFKKEYYPFYLENTQKINFSREQLPIAGGVPFYEILNSQSYRLWAFTKEGAVSPNGLVVKRTNADQRLAFTMLPGLKYVIRAYVTSSAYNTLYSHFNSGGTAYMLWKNVLYIGDNNTPYTGEEHYTVSGSGWIYINLPELDIAQPTTVSLYGNSGYSGQFAMTLYLDYLAITNQ